ncbi:hypothetical protein [Ferviditalea candida]|uniref:Uncharacterized protein n=1 Tax=Ferviditalea candida TaxID=3108399 RepID=A0ABU5ZC70_9BACL|nr:hypothetical protein [Paenibacillaceae bacterium T2]
MFKVKNYKKIVLNAKAKIKAKGKVKIKSFGAPAAPALYGFYGGFNIPAMKQRLALYADAATVVTVILEHCYFRGRVISIGQESFDVIVLDPGTAELTVGSLVIVSFYQVNAIGTAA